MFEARVFLSARVNFLCVLSQSILFVPLLAAPQSNLMHASVGPHHTRHVWMEELSPFFLLETEAR